VPDEGAASSPVHDTHSDSGVESTTEIKVKESPMDIDSDSSGKDSAVNVEPDSASGVQPGMMLTDHSTNATSHSLAIEHKSCDPEPVSGFLFQIEIFINEASNHGTFTTKV